MFTPFQRIFNYFTCKQAPVSEEPVKTDEAVTTVEVNQPIIESPAEPIVNEVVPANDDHTASSTVRIHELPTNSAYAYHQAIIMDELRDEWFDDWEDFQERLYMGGMSELDHTTWEYFMAEVNAKALAKVEEELPNMAVILARDFQRTLDREQQLIREAVFFLALDTRLMDEVERNRRLMEDEMAREAMFGSWRNYPDCDDNDSDVSDSSDLSDLSDITDISDASTVSLESENGEEADIMSFSDRRVIDPDEADEEDDDDIFELYGTMGADFEPPANNGFDLFDSFSAISENEEMTEALENPVVVMYYFTIMDANMEMEDILYNQPAEPVPVPPPNTLLYRIWNTINIYEWIE